MVRAYFWLPRAMREAKVLSVASGGNLVMNSLRGMPASMTQMRRIARSSSLTCIDLAAHVALDLVDDFR